MACVFGEIDEDFENWLAVVRWGARPNAVQFWGKNKKMIVVCKTMPEVTEHTVQDTTTRIRHLGFISRCTAYSVRWIAFRCCVSVRWIAFRCCVQYQCAGLPVALLPWNFAVEL